MCLTINKSGYPETADKNILVWKVIFSSNVSYYRDFVYSPHTLYTKERKFTAYKRIRTYVQLGYHSFKSRRTARGHRDFCSCKIVKFWIPAGANYYIGTNGELVSDSILSGDLNHCH